MKKSKNHKLNLFKNVKIHSIFNISLLKLVDLNTFIQEIFHYTCQKEQEFEIKQILKRRSQNYFVKWKKYDISKNT